MWTVKYGSKTLRVDAEYFKYGEKKKLVSEITGTCGKGSISMCRRNGLWNRGY